MEFAINSKAGASDAANYFPLFFHFDHFLHQKQFDHAVQFDWELEGALFTDAKVSGFTCSVFVNTAFCPTAREASDSWFAALQALEQFLGAMPSQSVDPIY